VRSRTANNKQRGSVAVGTGGRAIGVNRPGRFVACFPARMHKKYNKPVIGLVGGIGAGKTFVAKQLSLLGCAVIDSDELAREALEAPDVRRQVIDRWGEQVLDSRGRVDRAVLARVVFADADELRRLEQMIHPKVHELRYALRRRYQLDPGVCAIVEDCPLLLEKGLGDECDVTIFVYADRDKRLARVAGRGWSDKELADREKNQLGLDFKADSTDHVLDNNADEVHCIEQVSGVLSQILQALP